MANRNKLLLLLLAAVTLIAVFMTIRAGGNWDYILPSRGKKIAAMVLTGTAIALSTLIFQTLTNNRILTPSIIGLDSLYLLFQTAAVFILGSSSWAVADKRLNFLISVGMMMLFSALLYRLMFRSERGNLFFLILVGMIFGTFFQSLSTFMQVLIDPNEFLVVQGKMFASFSAINTDILLLAAIALLAAMAVAWKSVRVLDTLSLGRDHAINLGVAYDAKVKRLLLLVAVLVSVSTALVGPITFLGLLIANLAREWLGTHRHRVLLPGAALLAIIALVGGQLIVERVFSFTTTISVIINFVGGLYFLYLLLKENRSL
ncbi:iron chelate uptake ABC transporter family permease subunit [Gorillibacterium timonense]|uniref:iron chelate uptake ABC transporter family permease subunit n=1 Tax=Gorillibacterium timonense TaxID=1689269 RepID=UPI00071D8A26|nr:iron chelate uptake ABC transporter family permease subunit [Gorillibacterium timonense]